MTLYQCVVCNLNKPANMFWRSKRRPGPTKRCKACAWVERWKKINGRDFFSAKAQKSLGSIYSYLGDEDRIETFIFEIEQAVIQKKYKNYNYVAIRLGRSIEFLTYVLCDYNQISVNGVAKQLSEARKQLTEIDSKYASFVDSVGEKAFSDRDRQEIRRAFKEIINSLVEFEIEIAGGSVSQDGNAHTPPINSLIRRVGKANKKQAQAHHCTKLIAPFMNAYRNFAAHADAEGKARKELSFKEFRTMLRDYEQILSAFVCLIERVDAKI